MSSYQIGATQGGLATLKSMGVMDPRGDMRAFAETGAMGSGLVRGKGRPVITWSWGFLPAAQRDVLKAYCTGASAEVYIETRTNDASGGSSDVFDVFRAVMVWPEERPDTGRRLDFVIEFRQAVAV